MGTKHEDANLILKLYELRRDEVLRKARDWFIWFNPTTVEEIFEALASDKSGYFRMVTSYWDMAASLVLHGAIDEQMFHDANGEHMVVFAKLQHFISEIRAKSNNPEYLASLEKLVMGRTDANERLDALRARMKQWGAMRAEAIRKAEAAKAQAG